MGLRSFMAMVSIGVFACSANAAVPTRASAQAPRTCDSTLLPSCNKLSTAPLDAKGLLGFGATKDGGAIFNGSAYYTRLESKDANVIRAFDAEAKRLSSINVARLNKAKLIGDQIRKAAIDYLKSQTPASPEREALIARLATVEIDTETQPDESCGAGTLPGYPNVSYSPRAHTLFICAAAANVTAPQLIAGLTHEMGHIVSPCMAKSKAYTVDSDRLYPGELSGCSDEFSRYDRNMAPREDLNQTAMQLLDYKPKIMIPASQDSAIATLEGCKILSAAANMNPPSAGLFRETETCLKKKFNSSLERSDEFKKALLESGMSKEKAHAQMRAQAGDVCALDFEEAFADLFGASLFGHVTTGWTETDFQKAALPRAVFACARNPELSGLFAQYESSQVRVATLFSSKAVSERLRCEIPKSALSCPLQFSAPGAGESASAQPAKPNSSAKPTGSVK